MKWSLPASNSRNSILDAISAHFCRIEASDGTKFPDLGDASRLVLASDYSGEHAESPCQVLTFLIVDRDDLLGWDEHRVDLRSKFFPDDRRISFKDLGDPIRQKALGPFMKISGALKGMILSVAIDKSIKSIFAPGSGMSSESFAELKPHVFEKLMRIGFFGSFLVGGLSRGTPGLHWITDEDEILANDSRIESAGQVIGGMMKSHGNPNLVDFRLGIAGKFDDERRAEDVVSIADLVGGMIAEKLEKTGIDTLPRSTSMSVVSHTVLSTKTQILWDWISDPRIALKTIFCLIRAEAQGQVLVSVSTLRHDNRIPPEISPLWRPPDKGWSKSSKFWCNRSLV